MTESSCDCSNDPDFLSPGQLYDGYDEEYQCPILDEDRVSEIPHASFEPGSDKLIYSAQK